MVADTRSLRRSQEYLQAYFKKPSSETYTVFGVDTIIINNVKRYLENLSKKRFPLKNVEILWLKQIVLKFIILIIFFTRLKPK